ncbi:hypothetical protein SAMN04488498_12218 [Mesorhizobium albiziae]|uniref:Secreted protein n=1 Tax=Neomesorhizobium albiziae TaxID=335020 RepID=A0A1I4E2K5_9HYPH|nr:hypothetical protein GCM10007937_42320 [Mesorhizobium albiziae]SFL00005.1 hypothetical protein SAMN04488498_12218 [Mesorhizobium albiziae]
MQLTMLMQTFAAVGTVLATSAFAHAAIHSARYICGTSPCVAIGDGRAHNLIRDTSPARFPRRWPLPPSELSTE